MNKKETLVKSSLTLQKGFFVDNHYQNFKSMESSARNWKYRCTYQLIPGAISGHHQILHLENMQVAYSKRDGGIMQEIQMASDSIAIAVIEECVDKACFYRTKLKTGDIIFFDGSVANNLITNNTMQFRVLTIKKSAFDTLLLSKLLRAVNHTIQDKDWLLSTTLKSIWNKFSNEKIEKSDKDFLEAESKIYEVLTKLLNKQTPVDSDLTSGEETALLIREQVYNHMDGKTTIKSLSKQYSVSEKTLQNSFKSLFGFTPNKFLRYLKLNLVYHDLESAQLKKTTVLNIATKWGFIHMGHFSNYYTELFGENPSQTLSKSIVLDQYISASCVSRLEEL